MNSLRKWLIDTPLSISAYCCDLFWHTCWSRFRFARRHWIIQFLCIIIFSSVLPITQCPLTPYTYCTHDNHHSASTKQIWLSLISYLKYKAYSIIFSPYCRYLFIILWSISSLVVTFMDIIPVGYSDAGCQDCSCGPQWRMPLSWWPRGVSTSCHDSGAAERWHVSGDSLSRGAEKSGTIAIEWCCKLPELWIVSWLWHLCVMYYGINDVFDQQMDCIEYPRTDQCVIW